MIAIKMSNGTFRPVQARSTIIHDSFENPVGTLFKLHLKSKGEI